jgi:gliding motility-associated lipoprotein GldH
MAQFKTLPSEGWSKNQPIKFSPEYADSTLTYDILLSIRHNNSYQFSNLSLAVDMVDSVKIIHRKDIDFELSDNYGNWKGSGFGALYQASIVIATGIKPTDVNSIVVWQTMANCDIVKDVVDMGITVTPSR